MAAFAASAFAEPEEQSADYGEMNRDLPENMQAALADLITRFMEQDRFVRRREVMEIRKGRFFDRGDQYIYWNDTSQVYATGEAGGALTIGSQSVDMPRYMDVYDIYKPYESTITAVLTQNPPGVDFQPDDYMNAETDIPAAQTAEKYRHHIDRVNDRKKVQTEIARLFFTDGRVVVFNHLVTDKERFGVDDEGNPKTEPVMEVFGVLESKVPILAKCQSDMPYIILTDDPDIVMAKGEYPHAAAKIKEGMNTLGESAFERLARLGVLQGTKHRLQASDSFRHIVSRHRAFLRPECFEKLPDDVKDDFKAAFPDGIYATFCGTTYCESENLSMDDCLVVGHALPGDGQNRQGIGKPLIPIQESFNDLVNLWKEIFDYCIPTIWMDKVIDIQALREQASEPGNHQSAPKYPGEALQNMFWPEPESQVPPDLLQALDYLSTQLAQFVTGALPTLIGASSDDLKVAKTYQMAKDAALGRIGLPWGSLQEIYAKSYKQLILQVARDEAMQERSVSVLVGEGNKQQPQMISLKDLTKGKFHCFPDTDTSFPETTSAQRQNLMLIMQMAVGAPPLQQILQEPDNQEKQKEILGMTDWVIPGAEARDKQLREIEQLLRAVPIPPSPQELMKASEAFGHAVGLAAGTGQPPPPPPDQKKLMEALSKPSVPIDEQFDYHQFEYEECKAWLSSEKRVEEEEKGNYLGIENVRLHGILHFKQLQAQMAQMPPPAPAQGSPPKPVQAA